MSSDRSNQSNASQVHRFTASVTLAWFIFSFVTLMISIMALPRAGRYYDFRAFYAAGFLVIHYPQQLFDLHTQGVVQDAMIARIHPALPYYHPAFEALLYAPLALFTYHTAYILYAVFSLLLLAVCYLVSPQSAKPQTSNTSRALLFLSFPAFFCVVAGQDSILFLLLLCFLWKALDDDRDILAGVLLGLGLFKVQLVAALVLFLIARRGPRLLRSFLPTAAALTLLSLGITGMQGAAQWLRLLTSAVDALHQGLRAQDLISVHPMAMPTLEGLTYILGGRLLSPEASWALNLILLVCTFVSTLVVVRRSSHLSEAFAVAVAGALLLSPHLYLYDCLLLIPSLLLLAGRAQRVFIAIYCILPFLLFAVQGINWFAIMAVLPVAILATLLCRERLLLRQTSPEKVTPHPLTSLE